MARQYRQYHRHRRSYGHSRALQHIEEARRLSEQLGGTDEDVKEYFFALSDDELQHVLDEYEDRYGPRPREYAEFAMPRWRSGQRKMSGMVAERLFNLLPPRMPLATKYEMVGRLWKTYGPSSETTFTIGAGCPPSLAISTIENRMTEKVVHYQVPGPLERRFEWLSAGDVTVRQALLNHLQDEERKLIAEDLRQKLQTLQRQTLSDLTSHVEQQYKIGKHRLVLHFDPAADGIKEGAPTARQRFSDGAFSSNPVLWLIVGAAVWGLFILLANL